MFKILFRPSSGSLSESLERLIEFSSVTQMFEYLVEKYKAFDLDDIYISYYCYDSRIQWETFVVSVCRFGNTYYPTPQFLGFCTFKE